MQVLLSIRKGSLCRDIPAPFFCAGICAACSGDPCTANSGCQIYHFTMSKVIDIKIYELPRMCQGKAQEVQFVSDPNLIVIQAFIKKAIVHVGGIHDAGNVKLFILQGF